MRRRRFLQSGLMTTLVTPLSNTKSAPITRSSWTTAASLPINIQELYPAVHEGKLFVAGGIAAKLGALYFTDRFLRYDPGLDQWCDQASLPMAMHHAALVSSQNRLFLVGGFHGSYLRVWQMRGEVHEFTENGWQPRTALPAPQAEGVLATAPDGAIHLVGGQSPHGTGNSKRSDHREVHDHWRWEIGSSSWERAAPIPTARNSATGGWIGNSLLVTGGRTADGNLSDTEIYDHQEDRWRTANPLPLPQAGLAGAVHARGITVFGGEIFRPESRVFANVWRYDMRNDDWFAEADLPTPRHGLGACKIADKIYVIGGATKPSGRGTSNVNEVLKLS